MRTLVIVALIASGIPAQAGRGGGGGGRGFSEGGFTERTDESSLNRNNYGAFTDSNIGYNNYNYGERNYNYGERNYNGNAGAQVDGDYNRVGDVQRANVNVTGPNGNSAGITATKVGNEPVEFNGYRTGYYYNNGYYNQVNLIPDATYIAPVGAFAGWGVYTDPTYINYPSYATYPIETAIQIQLANLGYYQGEIDGNSQSVVAAIESYQAKNNLPVTGQITRDLLTQLGISCALPQGQE